MDFTIQGVLRTLGPEISVCYMAKHPPKIPPLMRNNFSSLLAIAAGTVLLSGAVRAETLKPKILKVVPDAVYANETDFAYPLYKIKVFGEKFAPEDSNLRIYLDGRDATVVWAKPPPKPTPAPAGATKPAPVDKDKDPEIYADRDAGSSRVDLWINKNHFHGTVNLTVGNAPADSSPVIRSDESVAIVLAERDFGCLFQIGAVAVSLLILALPIFLVKIAGSYGLPDKSRWLVAALFLDKETATYSLSKFQFYLWTAVSVFLVTFTCLRRIIWCKASGNLSRSPRLFRELFSSARPLAPRPRW